SIPARNAKRGTLNVLAKRFLRLSLRIGIDCVEVVANYRAHFQRHLTPLDRPLGLATILRIRRLISRSRGARSRPGLQVEILAACSALGFATQLLFFTP